MPAKPPATSNVPTARQRATIDCFPAMFHAGRSRPIIVVFGFAGKRAVASGHGATPTSVPQKETHGDLPGKTIQIRTGGEEEYGDDAEIVRGAGPESRGVAPAFRRSGRATSIGQEIVREIIASSDVSERTSAPKNIAS